MAPRLGGIQHHEQQIRTLTHGDDLCVFGYNGHECWIYASIQMEMTKMCARDVGLMALSGVENTHPRMWKQHVLENVRAIMATSF
jgi:hypothetical protein